MEPISGFGPRKLAAVREAFVRKGWARTYCNRQIGKIVRVFKWAASEELIPVSLHQALKTLAPLRRGHCEAPETEPRQPANPDHVERVLPLLPPHARCLIELIRLTGMRTAEACGMTLDQIDRTGAVWTYRPIRHKTMNKGFARAVALGEKAKAAIEKFLARRKIGNAEPLFSPHRQREERFAELRAKRKTRVQPSQMNRKKAKPKKPPGERFTPMALGHAVNRACIAAGVPRWTPYQLRHLKGAELREKFSLEHVRAALGHSHASMSAHYSRGADARLATEVAERIG